MRIIQKMDFVGFTFNNKHSSEMGILRVSGGSRYKDNLLPTSTDRTTQVPGGDGTYFFGNEYTITQFSINFASDSLTESEFQNLRGWLNAKDISQLYFDEAPYKVYSAKVTDIPTFSFICFDENDERIYKGEGTLVFTCYYPFAKSKYKWLSSYTDTNKNEWAAGSRLLTNQGNYDGTGTIINLYNAGDLEADFKAYYQTFTLTTDVTIDSNKDYYLPNEDGYRIVSNPNVSDINQYYEKLGLTKININTSLVLDLDFSKVDFTSDKYIYIDTYDNLIKGTNASYEESGNLYNLAINGGDFFKIPLESPMTLTSTGAPCVKIEYDYLYF